MGSIGANGYFGSGGRIGGQVYNPVHYGMNGITTFNVYGE